MVTIDKLWWKLGASVICTFGYSPARQRQALPIGPEMESYMEINPWGSVSSFPTKVRWHPRLHATNAWIKNILPESTFSQKCKIDPVVFLRLGLVQFKISKFNFHFIKKYNGQTGVMKLPQFKTVKSSKSRAPSICSDYKWNIFLNSATLIVWVNISDFPWQPEDKEDSGEGRNEMFFFP